MAEATIEDWKKRAEEWKRIADREATTCHFEYKNEIKLLKAHNKHLRALLERNGIYQ